MRRLWLLLLVPLAILVTPLLALPGPSAEEIEANRRVIGTWRFDLDHYTRLKTDLKLFRALPIDKQERMRLLDQQLHEKDQAKQEELWRVMDRYVTWLGRLSPQDREKIDNAGSRQEKLDLIRQYRDRDWLARIPPARQTEILAQPEGERHALIHRWREEALAGPLEVKKPEKLGQPRRLNEFPREIQVYIVFVLMPSLSPEERLQLAESQGKPWPEYARQVLMLSERHPMVFPGVVARPMTPRDLKSIRLKDVLPGLALADRDKIRQAMQQGKWPDTGITVVEVLRKSNQMPKDLELGPCRPRQFNFLTQAFIENLTRNLDEKERKQLKDTEGLWPEYPRLLLTLAKARNLTVPGMKLPEPDDWSWEKIRPL